MNVFLKLKGVCERDVDLLLLEEFAASPAFLAWWFDQIGIAGPAILTSAVRGATTSYGESDLQVVAQVGTSAVMLLIENKVDAAFQPRQGERYARRAATHRDSGLYGQVTTALVAPAAYHATCFGFEHRITYEAILKWFMRSLPDQPRNQYKCALLREAIRRGTEGAPSPTSFATTEFWLRYWELSSEIAPELAMPKPTPKPATSGFVRFKPVSLPKRVQLLHKVQYGHVDLQFAGMGAQGEWFVERYGSKLEPGMRIERAMKSLVVRVDVPELELERPLEGARDAVLEAIHGAQRLLVWQRRTRAATRDAT